MHINHIVPHINQEAAGPSYSVPALCRALIGYSHKVVLSCLAANPACDGVKIEIYDEWPILKRFAVSTAFIRGLSQKASQYDVVHNHSLWSMVNVATGYVVPGKGPKLVVSPRGTLSKWAFQSGSKFKQILWPFQRRLLLKADLLHATSISEYDELRNFGFKNPVAIIPNGIDLPELVDTTQIRAQNQTRTLLFLSRIHPKKGLNLLLDSWVQLQEIHPDWQLVIAGSGESKHVQEIKAYASNLGVERVQFPGALYGDSKSAAYFGAELFILPTHSENFGMVVAEALAHGCPAVVSRGAPWAGLETEECGWWVENSAENIMQTLDAAMRLHASELKAMGQRGRSWMQRDYAWESVGQKMDAAYRWLVHGGEPPACIRLD